MSSPCEASSPLAFRMASGISEFLNSFKFYDIKWGSDFWHLVSSWKKQKNQQFLLNIFNEIQVRTGTVWSFTMNRNCSYMPTLPSFPQSVTWTIHLDNVTVLIAVFRIRIHLIRIRIQGFDDQKLKKNFTDEKKIFGSETTIYVPIPRPP